MISQFKRDKEYFQSKTEYSLKNRTIVVPSMPITKSQPNDKLYKQNKKKAHCNACPTPNTSSMTYRIYTPQSNVVRTNKKHITVTPPCILKKEYYIQKKENAVNERFLFNKKKLKGKLFNLMCHNFIMDSTSYHLMNINIKENSVEKSNFKETIHGNEYRTKHQIGIVTKKTSDLFNTIPVTRRYEDIYNTPDEFVKNNFTENDIKLFENDPVYFQIENTPINQTKLYRTKHLKVRIDEEEKSMHSIKKKKNQVKFFGFVPEKKKVKLIYKMSRNNKSHSKTDLSSHFHPFDLQAYMSKLHKKSDLIKHKLSQYQERKSEIDEINSLKIEKREEIKMKRRSKQLQIATKLQQENEAITILVNVLKRNYQENTNIKC